MNKDFTPILIGMGIGVAIAALRSQKIGKIEDYEFPPSGKIDKFWGNIKPINLTGKLVEFTDWHVIPEVGVKKFNLHGVEFGNWMNQEDRLSNLSAGMEGLNDLAKLLNKKPIDLGFNRKLSLAFGARGNPRSAAHYETGSYTINLTKYNGSGSLGHEYGHFLDNIVGLKLKRDRLQYGSGKGVRKKPDPDIIKKRNIESEYEKLFTILYFDDNGNPTKYLEDQLQQTTYFQLRVEVWARTFEAFLHIKMKEKGIKNRYLQKAPTGYWPPMDLVKKAMPHIQRIVSYAFSK